MNSFRLYTGAWTIIYACALMLTVALLFWVDLPFLRPNHLWISLEALALAETAVYGTVIYGITQKERNGNLSIGYSTFVTVSMFYLVAVVIIIVLFSLLFDVSVRSYILIHIIAFAVAGVAAGLAALAAGKSVEDDDITVQTQHMQNMQYALRDAVRQLRGREEAELLRDLERLEEKVRFSDPVSHPTMLDDDHRLVTEAERLAADIRSYVELPERVETDSFSRRIRDLSDLLIDRNERLIQRK